MRIFVFCLSCLGLSASLSHGLHLHNGVFNMQQVEEERGDGFECTLPMFGNDTHAYMACMAENALQRNWYPSPIGGLFSYQVWNGFDGFWQNGIILETMLNFMHYARHTRYENNDYKSGIINGAN